MSTVASEAKYDVEFIKGEFGDNYTFTIKNDDGTDADISWATAVQLIIEDLDGVEKLNITTNLSISTPNVIWAMQSGQTDYDGDIEVQVILTNSGPSRKRLTKTMTGFVYKNKAV